MLLSCWNCSNDSKSQTQSPTQITVNAATPLAGQNFDLKALGEIVKQSKSPQEIEQTVNQSGGINNLDLDKDGNTDYIKVRESGALPVITYSFIATLKDGDEEIATVTIDKTRSTMNISGNQDYYPVGSNYTTGFTASDMFLLMWIMSPGWHPYYSPYHYGYYGSYYHPYRCVPYGAYHSRPFVSRNYNNNRYVRTSTPSSTFKNHQNVSTSPVAKRSISNTSSSQKSFSVRNTSAPVKSGGFGNNKYSGSRNNANSFGNSSSHSSGSHSSGSSHSFGSSHSSGGHSFGGGRSRSDIRSKENILIVDSASYKISQLKGVYFTYKKGLGEGGTQVGVIAQDVKKVLPEAVTIDKEGYYNVNYIALIPLLIESNKDLQTQVKDLQHLELYKEKQIETLNKDINSITFTFGVLFLLMAIVYFQLGRLKK